MRHLLLLLLLCCQLLVSSCSEHATTPTPESTALNDKTEVATCYGGTPCNACTSCSSCKYCRAGGTCGICATSKKTKTSTYKSPSPAAGRCQAITKKGTQCSRMARSGGYCWQHGG